MNKFLTKKSIIALILLILANLFVVPAWADVASPEMFYPREYINKEGKIIKLPAGEIRDSELSRSKYITNIKLGDKDITLYSLKGSYTTRTNKETITSKFDRINPFNAFNEGIIAVKVGDKCGYADEYGKIIIEPQFEEARNFREGLALVKKDGKQGYIDKTGKIVIESKYYISNDFSEGFALICEKGKYGYIDKSGKVVIEPQFDYAYPFLEGMTVVTYDVDKLHYVTKRGYIDNTGKKITGPQFDSASSFSKGLAAIEINKKWGYIDKTGKIVIKPQFTRVTNFSEGLAAVSINRKWGYINKTGKIVIAPQFDYAGSFKDGIAEVRRNPLKKSGLPAFPFGILVGITAWAGISVRKEITKENK